MLTIRQRLFDRDMALVMRASPDGFCFPFGMFVCTGGSSIDGQQADHVKFVVLMFEVVLLWQSD